MKPIQVTIEESLLHELDRHLRGHRRGRSAFIRESVRLHLVQLRIRALEEQERRGYAKKPIRKGELDALYRRQDWGPK